MKNAGCRRVYIGIESGSQRMLDLYKKGYKVKKIYQTIALLKKYQIEVSAFIMLGHPEETRDDFEQTMAVNVRAPWRLSQAAPGFWGSAALLIAEDF